MSCACARTMRALTGSGRAATRSPSSSRSTRSTSSSKPPSAGSRVPADLVQRGNAYLRALARRDGNNLIEERNSAYAIYLLTRQGQVMSTEAAALRKRLAERYAKEWQQDVAALWLGAALQLMRQESDARAHRRAAALRRAGRGFRPLRRCHDARCIPAVRAGAAFPEAADRSCRRKCCRISWSASRPTAITRCRPARRCLRLLLTPRATQADTAPQLSIAEVLRDKSVRSLTLPQQLMPKVDFSAQAARCASASGSDLNAYTLVEESRLRPQAADGGDRERLRDPA